MCTGFISHLYSLHLYFHLYTALLNIDVSILSPTAKKYLHSVGDYQRTQINLDFAHQKEELKDSLSENLTILPYSTSLTLKETEAL